MLRASKISLKRLWNILSPIFKIERINLLDGEVTDFKMLVERKNNAWSILSINWNFNDITSLVTKKRLSSLFFFYNYISESKLFSTFLEYPCAVNVAI